MTSAQQRIALIAIRAKQDTIRSILNDSPLPELREFAARELTDLEGAYAAIDAIETTE